MAGIYIHIPFCKQRCNYCNFHFSTSLRQKEELVAALLKEINLTTDIADEKISTIYFGGGTPSILSITDLQMLLDKLNKHFFIEDNAEITLEANPDDITAEKLKAWKQLGINRFSLGIQSFDNKELQWMNRAHTAEESVLCIDKIKDAGFTNFSIDLIYGSPLLSNETWVNNINIAVEKSVPHISCYALTVEPNTPLQKLIALKKKENVSSEKQSEQFLLLQQALKAAGYEHYEISNFAKPGMQSRHNSSYWQGKKYFGFGPSAHSYDGKKIRRWNVANNTLYINCIEKNILPYEEEILTPVQQLNEYIMTSLRTMQGLHLVHVINQFGKESAEKITASAKKWKATDKLIISNEKIILTDEGKLFADGIAADLFF
jgi:oxygen-independent coproporphyrinogen-3 oxidase